MTLALSPAALDLVLRNEGLNQPALVPPADSGVTLGYGYDLSHHTTAELAADWGTHLSPCELLRLTGVVGLHGDPVRAVAPQFRDIVITREVARAVFLASSVPKYMALTAQAFPGFEALPSDAAGALFSLVYNRGPLLVGDRRREMRAIARAVLVGDLAEIAKQLRLMKRLWVGQGVPGLLKRRDEEADLVEHAA